MLANTKQKNEFISFFVKSGIKKVYPKGSYIIHPFETPKYVYYIQEGYVKAFDITKYHEENLLIIRKQGEIFPLIWAITGEGHNIIYKALTQTTAYQVRRSDFLEYFTDNSDSLIFMLDHTIEMYKTHSDRILSLEYRTVRERLMSFLINTSNRLGQVRSDGSVLIEVPLRHQDVASSINSSRETASRELSALEKKGFIKNGRNYILINDIEKLKEQLN